MAAKKVALTTWEGIWYVLQNIAFGAAYFTKVPVKKALQDFGLVQMTSAEHFWYVVQCVFFGAGYFAKIPTAKALSELPQYQTQRQAALGTLSQQPTPPSESQPAAPNEP
jgi:hypothetical protein